ncbi:hypothetical protein BIW11_04771 [Tropilaelaps mercedesae]|uniref:Uncharacterized protein n=1 Tax=Tropilaelaps mercedesae TaxID=418985 RepID=A0A1V9X2B4_9ACAR|nr:hypothetical protein BIW11_04771 [Tropilaelaps mercedesae]
MMAELFADAEGLVCHKFTR